MIFGRKLVLSLSPEPGSGRISLTQKYQMACEERHRAQINKDIGEEDVEEVSIVKQSNVINPNEIEGKREFGFDVGDVLVVKYTSDDPPKGCSWMKDATFHAKVEK